MCTISRFHCALRIGTKNVQISVKIIDFSATFTKTIDVIYAASNTISFCAVIIFTIGLLVRYFVAIFYSSIYHSDVSSLATYWVWQIIASITSRTCISWSIIIWTMSCIFQCLMRQCVSSRNIWTYSDIAFFINSIVILIWF